MIGANTVKLRSGGRILSLAILGGLTFGTGMGPAGATAQTAPDAGTIWLVIRPADPCAPQSSTLLLVASAASARWPLTGIQRGCAQRAASADTAGQLLAFNLGTVATRAQARDRAVAAAAAARQAAQVAAARQAAQVAAARQAPASSAQPLPQAQIAVSAGPGAWTPVPGHASYALGNLAGDPFTGAYGTCTWYAWYRHQHEPLMQLGNAWQWAYNARAHGLTVVSYPVAGATVVFQPGVEGAGGGGHVAHVEVVLGGGWFIISEMNFYWSGGGWGRVDYRYAYAAPGVVFIL